MQFTKQEIEEVKTKIDDPQLRNKLIIVMRLKNQDEFEKFFDDYKQSRSRGL